MKAYKFGRDGRGEIWVSGARFERHASRLTRLLKRHLANAAPDEEIVGYCRTRLAVMEKYQNMTKHELSSVEQVVLHRIAEEALRREGRI